MAKLPKFVAAAISPLVLFFGFSNISVAEPWISNRYSQNCASCHAPGRWNLPAKKRRCTLSCQACHVSPQGGGLRNQYGKWNQQRWLKSFHAKKYNGSELRPAPHHLQPYLKNDPGYKLRKKFVASSKGEKIKLRREEAQRIKNEKSPNNIVKRRENLVPPKLVVDGGMDYRSEDFDYYSWVDWHIDAPEVVFLSRIPEQDPYYLERKNFVFAGGDLRYFYGTISQERDNNGSDSCAANPEACEAEMNAVMAIDLGVRYRPVEENISLVFETRYGNRPSQSKFEQAFTDTVQVKSAYFLADSLIYNSWFMAGLYRPMFGLHNVDHQSIANDITGLDQYAVAKAIGFGTAPNIPFANLSFIRPMADTTINNNKLNNLEGYVLNIGGRWVTNSFNVKYSIWSTADKISDPNNEVRQEMHSLTAGGMFFDRLITNIELIRAEENQVESGARNAGNVYTLDLKYRLWREMYFQGFYATSNISRNYAEGTASEVGFGFRGYFLPGMKLDIMLMNREDYQASNKTTITTELMQAQVHFFF